MEVYFTPELEAKLTHLPLRRARFVEAVKRGEDALQRGGYLTHEQTGQRLQRFVQA